METIAISDHKYNLRWPDYHDTILSTFRSLKAEEDFVDVTLSCEENQYSAHKVVLSACSPYFRKLLKNNPCQHPIIILRDVAEDDLRCLLNFMYNGEVQVQRDNIKSFLRTAETLQVKGLADHPLKEKCQNINSTSVSPAICENPENGGELDDYAPLLKRPRHHASTNGPLSPPLPCRQSPSDHARHNGGELPWPSIGNNGHRSSNNDDDIKFDGKYDKYDARDGDKSLLSQALEKSTDRGGEDSASDTTGSERPGSASMDAVKSEMVGGRDMEPHHPARAPSPGTQPAVPAGSGGPLQTGRLPHLPRNGTERAAGQHVPASPAWTQHHPRRTSEPCRQPYNRR